MLCLSVRPEGNRVVVELCRRHCRGAVRHTRFPFCLFLSLVGLLIGAAFNPFIFAEVMRLWQSLSIG